MLKKAIAFILLFTTIFSSVSTFIGKTSQIKAATKETVSILENGGMEYCTTEKWNTFVDTPKNAKTINFPVYEAPSFAASGNCYMVLACPDNNCDGVQSAYNDTNVENKGYVEIEYGGKIYAQDGTGRVVITLWELGGDAPISHSFSLTLDTSTYKQFSKKTYINAKTKTLRLEVYTETNDIFLVDDMYINATSNILRDEALADGVCTKESWATYVQNAGKVVDLYANTDSSLANGSSCFFSMKCADGICEGAHSIYQDIDLTKIPHKKSALVFGGDILGENTGGKGTLTVWQFKNSVALKHDEIEIILPDKNVYHSYELAIALDPTADKLRYEFYLEAPNVFRLDNPYIYGFDLAQEAAVFRFFNKINGAHLYTSDIGERKTVKGLTNTWNYEMDKYKVLTEQKYGSVPVYRFLNKENGAHLYTISEAEKNTIQSTLPKFTYEGIKYYVWEASSLSGLKPVYRFFNKVNGAHLYTTSLEETESIIQTLSYFQYEGIKFYVM